MNPETGEVSMDYERSQSIGALAAALAKAQGAIETAKKDAVNPHFNKKYADLASVMAVARGPLSANGLAVIQAPTTEGGRAVITTELMHASGEWLRCTMRLPVAQQTPQGFGSAFTYGRRYGYAAIVGIAADGDDDGNAASEAPAREAGKQTKAQPQQSKQQTTPAPPSLVGKVRFGKKKGVPLADLDNDSLAWYAQKIAASTNPEDVAMSNDIETEWERRGVSQTNGAATQ